MSQFRKIFAVNTVMFVHLPIVMEKIIIKHYFLIRCDQLNEDPFRSCFGCETESRRIDYLFHGHLYDYHNHIDRQTGEMFQATQQSRRVICSRGQNGAQRCRLRIDKAMQFRRVSYGRAVQFIQSEQYLKRDDVDII